MESIQSEFGRPDTDLVGKTFEKLAIDLSNRSVENCAFYDCRIHIEYPELPVLIRGNTFVRCEFSGELGLEILQGALDGC